MPAEAKVQSQAEADEKMVDLPSEGKSIDVELPKESEKLVNSDDDKDIDVGEKEVVVEEKEEKTVTNSVFRKLKYKFIFFRLRKSWKFHVFYTF